MRSLRLAILVAAASCLALGVAGGLARLGVRVEAPHAAIFHGLLMTGGFLGTVISVERAIALGRVWGFLAPIASAAGALLLLMGRPEEAAVLCLVAPLALMAVSCALLHRQPEPHIGLLVFAALCWAVGNAVAFGRHDIASSTAWWFAFLVLTIAAERLEMTRLMRRRRLAGPLFLGACAMLVGGAAAGMSAPLPGGALFGSALIALAAWLAVFDIARRTVRGEGFARYAAACLLGGYAWLAVAGAAWIAMTFLGGAWRDVALHTLALGFVFSMIFGHAPLVVPVVARVRMRYLPAFYAPVLLLHASLALRVAADIAAPALRPWAGIANAGALVLFAATLLYSLRRQPSTRAALSPAAP